jgi:hypothetical protein
VLATIAMTSPVGAQTLPAFEFTTAEGVRGWTATHDVSRLEGSPEGLLIRISGGDPYITGPRVDFPVGQRLWMRLRIRSDRGGEAQLFYFRTGATETDSVRFPVPAGVWYEALLPLPALGPGFRLRFDPPGTGGTALLAWMRFEARVVLAQPSWPAASPPVLGEDPFTLQSGDLQLLHGRRELGGLALKVTGLQMAVGHTRPLLGYLQGDQPRWVPVAETAEVTVAEDGATEGRRGQPATGLSRDGAISVLAKVRDADGGVWQFRQRFAPGAKAGAIDVETQVTVSRERAVLFLPMLTLLPGVGSFGPAKGQGLFPGLEYLDNEPSSSEADVIGPASRRQVPDTRKITFPLMAIQANDRYVGLIWEKDAAFSALFDSPDRLFRSGGHVIGILFPGSDSTNRIEGSLLPYFAERLPPGKPLTLRATLIGGRGQSVVAAVEQYVSLRGLPPVPKVGLDREGYVRLAAAGWLDSGIRGGDRYRHAYWPGTSWPLEAVPDAALLMEWLGRATTDAALSQRLRAAATGAIAQSRPADWNTAGITHIRYPAPSLVYGEVATNSDRGLAAGQSILPRFLPDGTLPYSHAPGSTDFGRTHFAPDANGHTAAAVKGLLEAAVVSGDAKMRSEALRMLRALNGFANSVPRGAQTWEVPLHTPDILASAYLVRCYTLGYELTGEKALLDQARYWAWTGVPFLYLVPPADGPIGLYASVPVFGATNWTGSWFGRPVQWCGLVYADALYRFLRYDPGGPWKRIADGITASGIQQTWPLGDPKLQGLLPDAVDPRFQARHGVAINPGTLQVNAIRFFDGPVLYDFRSFREGSLLVHAPGAITDGKEEPGRVSFTVRGWSDRPYFLLIVGLTAVPRVRIDGRETLISAPHRYLPQGGRLILQVTGSPKIQIETQ